MASSPEAAPTTSVAPLTVRSGRVRAARELARRRVRAERGLFLAEGWKAVGAASTAGLLVEVFVTSAARDEHAALLDADDVPIHVVDDRALGVLADAVTPQGLVGVCRMPTHALSDAVGGDLVVIGAGIGDPGNAGTLVRTADAVAASGVVLTGDSVDPFNAKAVRASVGSLFHLPVAVVSDPATAVAAARETGHRILATTGDGDLDLFDLAFSGDLAGPVAWLFGNEAHGLDPGLVAAADRTVAIPMPGGAESLNLATAAAVCLYATLGARRGLR